MRPLAVELSGEYGNDADADADEIFSKLIFKGELWFISEDGDFGIKVGAEFFEKREAESKQSVFFYDFNFADGA